MQTNAYSQGSFNNFNFSLKTSSGDEINFSAYDNKTLQYQSIKDDRVLSFYALDSDKREAVLYTPYRVRLGGKCSLGAVTTENMYNERQNDYDLAQRSFNVK